MYISIYAYWFNNFGYFAFDGFIFTFRIQIQMHPHMQYMHITLFPFLFLSAVKYHIQLSDSFVRVSTEWCIKLLFINNKV